MIYSQKNNNMNFSKKKFIEITLVLSSASWTKLEKIFESDEWEDKGDYYLLWKPHYTGKSSDRIQKSELMKVYNATSNYGSYTYFKDYILCEAGEEEEALKLLIKSQKENYLIKSNEMKNIFKHIDKVIRRKKCYN